MVWRGNGKLKGFIMETAVFIRTIAILGLVGASLATAPAVLAGDPPPQYAASCGACHAVGVAGAVEKLRRGAGGERVAHGSEPQGSDLIA
mgnify:CR=1 FL=1